MTPTHQPTRPGLNTLLITALAALALSACGRDDGRTPGQKLDSTIAKTEQGAAEAKADIKQEASELSADAKAAAERAKQAVSDGAAKAGSVMENAADKVANSMADAAITTSVNAELAKDPTLSALRIDVDTHGGHVKLSGSAPSKAARDRATQLAQGVKGVSSVDNQLEVRG